MTYFAQWDGLEQYIKRHARTTQGEVMGRIGYASKGGLSTWKLGQAPLAGLKALISTFGDAEADTVERSVRIIEHRHGGRPVPMLARQLAADYDKRRAHIRWEAPLQGGGKIVLRVGDGQAQLASIVATIQQEKNGMTPSAATITLPKTSVQNAVDDGEMVPMDEFRELARLCSELRKQRDAAVADALQNKAEAATAYERCQRAQSETEKMRAEMNAALKQAQDWKDIADDADKTLQQVMNSRPKPSDGQSVVRTINRLNTVSPDLAQELAKLGKQPAPAR